MTALFGPDRDQLRQQLADALPHEPWCHHDMDCCGCTCEDARVLAVEPLLPVVESHTALPVAAELVYAAKSVHHSEDQEGYRWMTYRASEWSTTAAALRTHEGDTDDQ